MNNLLLFFALPIATIILASALETILHSPIRVASVFFAIFLIVTFAVFDETFLIFAIAYTILAYLSAVITRFILKITHCRRQQNDKDENTIETNSATVNTINATINAQNIESITDNNSNGGNCTRNYRFRRF